MAFLIANFAPAGNQSRRGASTQEYVYKTTDSQATVAGAGYFNQVISMLNFGDAIIVEVVDNLNTPTAVTNRAPFLVTTLTATSVTATKTIPALADDDSDDEDEKKKSISKTKAADKKDSFGTSTYSYTDKK